MKKLIQLIGIIVIVFCTAAFVTSEFTGWDDLINNSSEIVVLRCITPRALKSYGSGLINSQVEVVDVLKGNPRENSTNILKSGYLPHQGDYYLVFSKYQNGSYVAPADYQIVAMGVFYHKDMAVGKTLEDKVRTLLKDRLYMVNKELERDQAEKQRLEQAFK